ncbi:uncharacterized membrane protein YgdD (TMEM256/DUF423 family) [Modicisalibacter xianhensis]|uniref:Uncharacterized membrane protein YgdD (TMEM256/DUF423 family) n=1 Tax=Modicisalibacter xianhensis TaxID=442341 RepID=A0A4R8FYK0_9GAMM|nr:DUF423 domain-containing protein [Halomonas xianhensis]TDX28678.1 uncharacterized membrane protein YgdD (TMEM256/DUF423 family) [Halomonas xianhensis]
MRQRPAWVAMALSGLIMVMAGAFGAHGLEGRVSASLLEAFETGVRYQAWHTLAILGVLIWRQQMPLKGQPLVLWLWGTGIVLFSGSLYLLALAGTRGVGMVTPLGGVLLMVGWLALAVTAWRARP